MGSSGDSTVASRYRVGRQGGVSGSWSILKYWLNHLFEILPAFQKPHLQSRLSVVIYTGFQITLFSLAAKKSATCFSFKKKKAWIQFYIGNRDAFVKKEGAKTLMYPKGLNICHFRVFCSKVQHKYLYQIRFSYFSLMLDTV